MAGKIMNKVMDMFCLNDSDDEKDYEEDMDYEDIQNEINEIKNSQSSKINSKLSKKDNRVVRLPIKQDKNEENKTQKVVIVKPFDFDETAGICDNLKENKIVVVNTNGLESKIAQRLLDFVGGATYVLNVQIREIDRGIYMFLPCEVDVSNSLKKESQNKGVFSFIG